MLVCIIISNAIQNQTGSNPSPVTIGIASGTRINMIEIRSITKPAIKVMIRMRQTVPHGPKFASARMFCNASKPPAPANTPANIRPPMTMVSTIAVIESVVSNASRKTCQENFRYSSVKTSPPIAPIAAASVGTAIAKMMLPNTATISDSGGTKTTAVRQSWQTSETLFSSGSGGGAAHGRTYAKPRMYRI